MIRFVHSELVHSEVDGILVASVLQRIRTRKENKFCWVIKDVLEV